jgi:hypothetical protein
MHPAFFSLSALIQPPRAYTTITIPRGPPFLTSSQGEAVEAEEEGETSFRRGQMTSAAHTLDPLDFFAKLWLLQAGWMSVHHFLHCGTNLTGLLIVGQQMVDFLAKDLMIAGALAVERKFSLLSWNEIRYQARQIVGKWNSVPLETRPAFRT